MRIKIISDGTPQNTSIVNMETGQTMENVIGIQWEIDIDRRATAWIHVHNVPAELVANALVEDPDEIERNLKNLGAELFGTGKVENQR